MGCFNKIGFISGLPIQCGDPTVLIFMKAKKNRDISGVTYPTDWFTPAFLPIFGSYDDYGKIENVQVNNVTKFIEEFFEDSIDNIIEIIDDASVGRGGEKAASKYDSFTFGLEHKEVYDFMSSQKSPSYIEGDATIYWLSKMGFKKSDKPTSDARFNENWTHESLPSEYEIHSDGTWLHLMKDGKQDNNYSTYHPNTLEEALSTITKGKYISSLSQEDKEECMYDLAIKLTIESYASIKEEEEALGEGVPDNTMVLLKRSLRRMGGGRGSTHKGMYLLSSYASEAHLDGKTKCDYADLSEFVEKIESNLLSDFLRFYSSVSRLNGKYCPSNYGSQDQDLNFHYNINKVYRDVITNKALESFDDDLIKKIKIDRKIDDRQDGIIGLLNSQEEEY